MTSFVLNRSAEIVERRGALSRFVLSFYSGPLKHSMTARLCRRSSVHSANSISQRRIIMANQKPDFAVYTIIENNGSGEDYWQRVGSAWTNKDGSVNLSLNALPLNGKLHIREPKAEEDSDSK